MTFREFITSEQGTAYSMTGFNAGGRAGQSQATPEMGVTQPPNMASNPMNANSNKVPASPFNVSDKLKGLTPRAFGSMNAGGVKPLTNPPPSPISPRGLGSPKPQNPNQMQMQQPR